MWDLYGTEPVMMVNEEIGRHVPAIVTKINAGGAVVWNMDVIVSMGQTGYAGCGPEYMVFGLDPAYVPEKDCWAFFDEPSELAEGTYDWKAVRAADDVKAWWEKNKEYGMSREECQAKTDFLFNRPEAVRIGW